MNIRRYQSSDRDRLVEITLRVFAPVSIDAAIQQRWGLLNDVSWQDRRAAAIDADLQANPDGVFVAERRGEVVGFITTTLDDHTRTGRIPNLAVASDHQGQGIGKALMTAALDYFQQSGMIYARIETLTTNEVGQTFYPQVGFSEVSRQIYYFMRLEDRQDL